MQINELIEKAVQCLEAIELDPETIYDYRCSAFKPIAERMLLMSDVKLSDIMAHEQYFTMVYQNETISRQTYNWRIRGIRILCEVLETGTFVWKVYSKKPKICLPEQFETALISYLDKQTCCEKRRCCYESICRRFFQYVSPSVKSISEIKPVHVRNFIVQISETRPKSMDDVIAAIKGLFSHLYETGQYEDSFWKLLSSPRSRGHKVLNCVSCDETLEILKVIDPQTNDGKCAW